MAANLSSEPGGVLLGPWEVLILWASSASLRVSQCLVSFVPEKRAFQVPLRTNIWCWLQFYGDSPKPDSQCFSVASLQKGFYCYISNLYLFSSPASDPLQGPLSLLIPSSGLGVTSAWLVVKCPQGHW